MSANGHLRIQFQLAVCSNTGNVTSYFYTSYPCRELESSAVIIEELKGVGSKKDGVDPTQKSLINVRAQLYESQQKVEDLKEQLMEAEESAKDKAEELSDTITKLRKYESGEYGLKEAVDEIHSLKKSVAARDKQVDELMNQTNNLQYENNEVAEENSDLRERLGLTERERGERRTRESLEMKSANTKQQDRALVQVMQREIERLEEERIQLKTDNRKLAQQLGQRAAKLGLNSEDMAAIQEYTEALKNRRLGMTGLDGSDPGHAIKMHEGSVLVQRQLEERNRELLSVNKELSTVNSKNEEMMEENNKLREGMHEILDSIKDQDGKSDVVVSCPTLEQLLIILDARHYYGDYKPAMGLKSQMEKLDGVNSHLRDQLRKLRIESDKANGQNQKLRLKLQQAEAELKALKEGNSLNQSINLGQSQTFAQLQPIVSMAAPPGLPAQIASSSKEIIQKLESQLIQVLDELDSKSSKCKSQEKDIENYNKKLNINKHQLGLLYEEHHKGMETLRKEKSKLQEELDELKIDLAAANAKNVEYEDHLNDISPAADEISSKYFETARKIAILKSNEAIITRKYRVIEDQNESLMEDCKQLKAELITLECHAIKSIGELQRYKELYCFKVDSLQSAIEESVPLSSLENANRQYNEITAKYRDLLQKQQTQSLHARNVEELELQLQSYKQEKQTYKKELKLSKEKIISLESIVSSMGCPQDTKGNFELEKLSKQVATLEVKELNERQKNDHLNNQFELLKTQMQHLEKRNSELEDKFDLVTKANMDLQKIERELRDQLVTSIPKEDFDSLKAKHSELLEVEVQLKIEQNKLKEIADISQIQISDFEQRKDNSFFELEALKHQVLDLQSQSDEKALIGRLHQQVLSLQMKETEFLQKLRLQESKLGKMETNVLKANKRSDEMEQYCLKIRSQFNIKMRSLTKIIQDLRRQYSGAIPLLKQEKVSKNLIAINQEKQMVSKMLKETETKLKEMEEKSEEMEVKQQGIDEVLSTLKNKSGTKQVIEWHSKLENLRIKELHSRRNAEHWEKEVSVLRDICNVETRKAENFEDEVVRLESLLEQKQLEWEAKDIELENSDVTDFKEMFPDHQTEANDQISDNLPLAQQLDSSMRKNRSLGQEITDLKGKLQDSKKAFEELNRKFRESENQNLAKEKMINDLRDQLPTSVDRAIAITSVIGTPSLTGSDDNKQATFVAQTTIESLRERLKQKEATMAKYEDMLRQSNEEHDEIVRRRQEEIFILQNTIRSQQKAFNELRSSRSNEAVTSGAQIGQHVARVQELEDEVQELQASVGQLSTQLMESRRNNEKLGEVVSARQSEVEELRENNNIQSQIALRQQKELIEKLNNEIRAYKQENIMLKDDVARMESTQSKAPSVIMKSLVEKLRHDLAEKERKQKAMTRVIAELKDEMLAIAEERGSSSRTDVGRSQSEVQRIIDKETKSYQTKISELNVLVDKLKKQIKTLKDSETKSSGDITKLREQVSKKTSLILKLKEEKMTNSRGGSRARQDQDEEREELKNQVEALEEKLRIINTAEKPYEDDKESKIIKNAEEVARWDERKKWQKKIEEFKARLKEADGEVSKMSKQNNNLRETISRLDREKMINEQKWKTHLRSGAVKTSANDVKVEQLEQEVAELRSELESRQVSSANEPGNETLKLRVKFLQGRVEQQERKISMLEIGKKGGQSALFKEIEELRKKETNLDKSKSKIEEENVDLKIKVETIQHNMVVMKEFIEKLEASVSVLKSECGNQTLVENIDKIIENVDEIIKKTVGNGNVTKVGNPSPQKKSPIKSPHERRLSQEVDSLKESLQSLKDSNVKLLETVEIKERKINEFQILLREAKKKDAKRTVSRDKESSSEEESSRMRQLEVDLKRKSDLLSEVKVLLRQAADRERQQETEKETLKRQLKIVTDFDPKTPSEALAKELRLARLTIERLDCEKRELEHEISVLRY